jgi:hypothetical protein
MIYRQPKTSITGKSRHKIRIYCRPTGGHRPSVNVPSVHLLTASTVKITNDGIYWRPAPSLRANGYIVALYFQTATVVNKFHLLSPFGDLYAFRRREIESGHAYVWKLNFGYTILVCKAIKWSPWKCLLLSPIFSI